MVRRRTFLKLGLAGGALLVAGGTASWLAGRDSVAGFKLDYKGEIVEEAAPETFFTHPVNERTKLFLSQILGH
mgnify:CR=1 FL=1